MKKIKPLLPSLREKKRYVVFEVLSDSKLNASSIKEQIMTSALNLIGERGVANAGILFPKETYNPENQRGILRVNNKYVNEIKSALALVQNIENEDVIVKSVGVSGILKKAQEKYLAG